ncbi:MAG: flippase-like domain-containing protein, partial [Prevotella sp.]|nr:flippase-like domain-containing protein [Prevotella sp.]
MNVKRIVNDILRIAFPLVLGGAILYWMYRGFDFAKVKSILLGGMSWKWMLLSLPFGILAQMFRGWRWMLTLSPLGERPRPSLAVHSVFLSYASSLIIPRVGEFLRCGVLRRYDRVSFPKALGTVVTERIIDALLVGIIMVIAFFLQMRVFSTFFSKTGTSIESVLSSFSLTGYIVTIICAVSALILLHFLLRRLSFYERVKTTLKSLWQGIISLKRVKNIPLFLF